MLLKNATALQKTLLLCLGILTAGFLLNMRFILVNMMKLPTGPEYAPWYYLKLHCSFLPPWDAIYTGSPFCIGADVRLLLLVPFAVFCFVYSLIALKKQKSSLPK